MTKKEIRQSLKLFLVILSVCLSALIAATMCIIGVILLSPVIMLGFMFPYRIGEKIAVRVERKKVAMGRAFAKRMIGKVMS